MDAYLDVVKKIYDEGVEKGDRTGTGTKSIFGAQMRFDLTEGFPLLTAKKTFFRSLVHELLWMISGDTNIQYLTDNNVHIWDEWADENGDLGPVYGSQWRKWDVRNWDDFPHRIDQLADAIEMIRNNPNSRRIIVTAWNPAEVDRMGLPPCHMTYQFYVSEGKLSCHMYQRSADAFLGVPFNIASYALLTHMVAQVTGLGVGDLIVSFGDIHLYLNHMDQAGTMLSRNSEPLPPLPTLRLNSEVLHIDGFTFDDIEVEGYNPLPYIKAAVSV